MIGTSLLRVLRGALQNFWRNIWLSIATTIIMTITLLVVVFLYFANVFGLEVIRGIQQKVDLSIDFRDGVTAEQMQSLARQVGARPDVESTKIISREEAREIFLRNSQDRTLTEESLREVGENPLPASMYIVATDPRFYEDIAQAMAAETLSPLIAKVQYEQGTRDVIEKLVKIVSAVKNVAAIVTVVFAVLVMLIMFNTVRLAIYSFREEIDIMHLVGASRWFIRGPFLIESILVALVATTLATAIVYPVLETAAPGLQNFIFQGLSQGEPFNLYAHAVQHWPTVVGLQALVAVTLAGVSSLTALQRYLKA